MEGLFSVIFFCYSYFANQIEIASYSITFMLSVPHWLRDGLFVSLYDLGESSPHKLSIWSQLLSIFFSMVPEPNSSHY